MRKIITIAGLVVLILFVAINWFKKQPGEAELTDDVSSMTIAEKNKTQRFWEIYRKAGKQRLADNLGEAYESYQRALELNSDHENALYYFGSISFALDKFREAEKAWKRLLRVNPTNARAHYQLGDLYLNFKLEEFFDIDKAEAEYRSALKINKEESRPHLRLGHVALINGDLQLAGQHLDDVIGSHFKSVEAYFLKGYVAWREGNFGEALTMLTNAKKHSKPLQPVQGVLGEGDTKPGGLLEQQKLSRRRSMFYPYFSDISELDESQISRGILDERYRKLTAFLQEIRKRKR